MLRGRSKKNLNRIDSVKVLDWISYWKRSHVRLVVSNRSIANSVIDLMTSDMFGAGVPSKADERVDKAPAKDSEVFGYSAWT